MKDRRLEVLQTHDAAKDVAAAFHVGGYPTYVILDGDGMMRLRAVGIEGDLEGTVKKLLAEQEHAPGVTAHRCRRAARSKVPHPEGGLWRTTPGI